MSVYLTEKARINGAKGSGKDPSNGVQHGSSAKNWAVTYQILTKYNLKQTTNFRRRNIVLDLLPHSVYNLFLEKSCSMLFPQKVEL